MINDSRDFIWGQGAPSYIHSWSAFLPSLQVEGLKHMIEGGAWTSEGIPYSCKTKTGCWFRDFTLERKHQDRLSIDLLISQYHDIRVLNLQGLRVHIGSKYTRTNLENRRKLAISTFISFLLTGYNDGRDDNRTVTVVVPCIHRIFETWASTPQEILMSNFNLYHITRMVEWSKSQTQDQYAQLMQILKPVLNFEASKRLIIRNAISVSDIVHHWFAHYFTSYIIRFLNFTDQRNCGPLTQKFLQTGLHESLVLFAVRSGLAWMDESFWLLPKINYREYYTSLVRHHIERTIGHHWDMGWRFNTGSRINHFGTVPMTTTTAPRII
ncbi:hypothetical protein ABKN59_008012 [Abortiporus biennis]